MKTYKLFIALTAMLGLSAVILGSMSSHLLDQDLSKEALEHIDTGLKYQFYHVCALLGIAILSSLHRNQDSSTLKISGYAFILGIILFSGSLYSYAITGNEQFSRITPFGGISFILGWLFLFFFSFRKQ